MDRQAILKELRAERDRLDTAIRALEGTPVPRTTPHATPRDGKPTTKAVIRKTTSGLTPAGRKKLSQMMKARWAARRKAAKTKQK